MDCKITFISSRISGATLVEVMISAALSSLLLLAVAAFSLYGAKSCAAVGNYSDLEMQSRLALDRMSQRIRQSRAVVAFTSTSLRLKDADGTALDFSYDPKARTLVEVGNGTTKVLLKGCDYVRFEVFQRNPVAGSYDAYPIGTPGTGKLVQLTWVCSRTLLGARLNTETVQSAKVVIRKRG
jgi:Tfp pilus assembly protein PilW